MKVSDIDSILHLLQSISVWGILFLMLIILPIYIIGWAAIFKLLKLDTNTTKLFTGGIIVSIVISLVLLKIGIEMDKKLNTEALQISNYILGHYNDYWFLDEIIKDNRYTNKDKSYFDNLIDRFPDKFTIAYVLDKKVLQVIDSNSIMKLKNNIQEILPVIRSEIKSKIGKGATSSIDSLYFTVDERISWILIEKLVVTYPNEFKITSNMKNGVSKIEITRTE